MTTIEARMKEAILVAEELREMKRPLTEAEMIHLAILLEKCAINMSFMGSAKISDEGA